MATMEIEVRVSALESEMDLLKRELRAVKKSDKPWWDRLAGTFADDPTYDEAMRLGREYRLAQRENADKNPEAQNK